MSAVSVQNSGNVALITINRLEEKTALNLKVLRELRTLLDQLSSAGNLVALIVTGEEAFLGEIEPGEAGPLAEDDDQGYGNLLSEIFVRIKEFPVPVIAAVNGVASGYGCKLAMACHLRVAASRAIFSLPISPRSVDERENYVWPDDRLRQARDLMLKGQALSAAEAFRLGLVDHVGATALGEARSITDQMQKLSRNALRACVKAVTIGSQRSLSDALLLEREIFASMFSGPDVREGTKAFFEKREPDFGGSP